MKEQSGCYEPAAFSVSEMLAPSDTSSTGEAAAKFGHVIPRPFVDLQFDRTAKMGKYRPSSLIDYEEGREVELEEIWGEPVRRAKTQGVPVPRLEMLYWLIKRMLAARKGARKAR